jgi:hypothetical protein
MRLRIPATLLLCATLGFGFAAAEASASRSGGHHGGDHGHRPYHLQRCNGERGLCAKRFNEVVLAGAHNAMSAADLGWKIPNQTIDIPTQLRYGIRALLFDTHYGRLQPDGTVRTDDNGKGTTGVRGLYLCHVLCEIGASPLIPVLRRITRFLEAHPRNVLLIDNEDYISPADFAAAMRWSGLRGHVFYGQPGPVWPTLRRMIATRQQVVVLAEHDAGQVRWYHRAYDGIMQETPYTFATPNLLIDPVNWPSSCRPNRGGTNGSLFLINHWSPATPPAVPNPDASAAVNAKSVILGRARACQQIRGRLPSVIAADQVTYGGLLAAVHWLNLSGE